MLKKKGGKKKGKEKRFPSMPGDEEKEDGRLSSILHWSPVEGQPRGGGGGGGERKKGAVSFMIWMNRKGEGELSSPSTRAQKSLERRKRKRSHSFGDQSIVVASLP